MEIMKQTDEIRVDTYEEAKALIEKFKSNAKEEGYDVISSAATLKEKNLKEKLLIHIILLRQLKDGNMMNYKIELMTTLNLLEEIG